MSTTSLLNLRSARSFAPRLRTLPARPLIQLRGKATAPFRLPDPRNEPNVRENSPKNGHETWPNIDFF
jgi:1-pyrroline-5-carboxylate dehydrogenase